MFLLQSDKDKNVMGVDYAILREILDFSGLAYVEMLLKDFYNKDILKDISQFPENYKNAIPLGTIEFVHSFLRIFKNISQMNPIEIPPCLRTDEFLKRKYSIVKGIDVPKSGRYFIKNASTLKSFTYSGDIAVFWDKDSGINGLPPICDDLYYQVSEIIDIKAEYRVYVIGGKIYAIAYYDGDPCVFPDVKLIQKANIIYSMQKDYPKSYTMDIMVNDKGTSIIEIHPLFSCGIYQTVIGRDFLYGYKDSMNYLEKHNTEQTEFSNFKTES